ncbi:MAG: PIN domain-containing protein [Methylococcales bacterium]|nr:PIN domain-containing protein [Methylococcales bacterium]
MKVVVDTNIVFSTMLSKNSFLRQTLLRSDLQFYAPNYLFTELFKHKERILSLSSETEQNIYVFLTVLLEHINFLSPHLISKSSYQTAYALCKNIDEADTPFVALTIELSAVLWTGDKRLKDGLQKQGFNHFLVVNNL